jgi:hypothetical protein
MKTKEEIKQTFNTPQERIAFNSGFTAGFEEFRGKVEEKAQKIENGWLSISREAVLETIKGIKQIR